MISYIHASDPRAEAGRAHRERHELFGILGLPFQSLNFGKCQITLTNGNIALLQIGVALPVYFLIAPELPAKPSEPFGVFVVIPNQT